MKTLLREYLAMGPAQRGATWILLSAFLFGTGINYLMPYCIKNKNLFTASNRAQLLAELKAESGPGQLVDATSELKPFTFDPNSIDSPALIRMGWRPRLIKTLMNYRRNGGRFYNTEKFAGLYGLQPEEWKILKPFVRIEKASTQESKRFPVLDLNRADTGDLVQLPMIGSRTAQQIVEYRDQLGGYVRINQVMELYGMGRSRWDRFSPYLSIRKTSIRTLNLNTATFSELNAHPYLKGPLAQAICDLRKQKNYHFNSVEELREIPLMNAELFRKIAPYITVN